MDRMSLINAVKRDQVAVQETHFPLDIFPERVQAIVFNLSHYENYNIEYCASIMLSAIASAIGNSYQIHIKGAWSNSPSLYMMLVGRPGLGKTPPLGFLYKPIREQDEERYYQFCDKMQEYESQSACEGKQGDGSSSRKYPNLIKTVISDFTAEAMLNAHKNNLRGISVVVDEILGLFKSVNRYTNKGNLIELLLTSYSGQPLDYIRKSERYPIHIKRPCINLIGSIQTNLLGNVFCDEYSSNGLLDRFLFVYPNNRTISEWKRTAPGEKRPDIEQDWEALMKKILNLPCPLDDSGNNIEPQVLEFSDDAEEYFYDWNNHIIRDVNAVENDLEVDSRKIKLCSNAGRLALILQVMKWATEEGSLQFVDLESVKGAIRLIDYYEDTYQRLKVALQEHNNVSNDDWIEEMGDTFTTAEAEAALKGKGYSKRFVFKSLGRLTQGPNPRLMKPSRGCYTKTFTSGCAPCSSAQDEGKTQGEVHTAQVHDVVKVS